MAKQVLIELRDLNYQYPGGEKALNHIDLKIYRGEKLAVLGSNGAGKSTLFLNLNGVLRPDSGEIYLKEKLITGNKKDLYELRKTVGIIFQNADYQIIASTVKDEVAFGPLNMGISPEEIKLRIDRALEEMNILSFKDRAPHELSGGEKKRVTIADIIAMDPDIFIFDEPTAALDPLGAEVLEETIEKLSETGKTVIISTHLVDFAWRWADRIIVLSKGEIIGEGSPLEVFLNEALLKRAHLKRPVLIDIKDLLVSCGVLPVESPFPRTLEELKHLLNLNFKSIYIE